HFEEDGIGNEGSRLRLVDRQPDSVSQRHRCLVRRTTLTLGFDGGYDVVRGAGGSSGIDVSLPASASVDWIARDDLGPVGGGDPRAGSPVEIVAGSAGDRVPG